MNPRRRRTRRLLGCLAFGVVATYAVSTFCAVWARQRVSRSQPSKINESLSAVNRRRAASLQHPEGEVWLVTRGESVGYVNETLVYATAASALLALCGVPRLVRQRMEAEWTPYNSALEPTATGRLARGTMRASSGAASGRG